MLHWMNSYQFNYSNLFQFSSPSLGSDNLVYRVLGFRQMGDKSPVIPVYTFYLLELLWLEYYIIIKAQ